MKTVVLKDLVKNSSSNEEGTILFKELEKACVADDTLLLLVDADQSLSSSFLNTSFGTFLDNYGLSKFKKTVKIKGSKNQFLRLTDYISKYNSLYLA